MASPPPKVVTPSSQPSSTSGPYTGSETDAGALSEASLVVYLGGVESPAGSGRWRIINRNSDKCLDIDGNSSDDGRNLMQWECIAGSLNQQFELVRQ